MTRLHIKLNKNWKEEERLHLTDNYLTVLESIRKTKCSCHFCGYDDGPFMEVHHLNNNHNDFSKENLVPCCTLCHRTMHLGWSATKGLGELGYIPEIIEMNTKHKAPSLEVFSQLQRFNLINKEIDTNPKIKFSSLMKSFDSFIINKQRINLEEQHLELLNKRRLESLKNNERLSEEEAREAQINSMSGDDLVASTYGNEAQIFSRDTTNEQAEIALEISSANLLDLAYGLGELLNSTDKKEQNKAKAFIDSQKTMDGGKFVIIFNKLVYKPFEPEPKYIFEERIEHYKQKSIFKS